MDEENEQFECPECKTLFGLGTVSCPGCGMEFEWDEEQTEEALDELIEQVEEGEGTEVPYDPSPEPEVVADTTPDEVTEAPYDPTPEPEVVAAIAAVETAEPPLEEAPMAVGEPPAKKKALSMLGIVFAFLAVVSVIGLLVVLNYDTWIDGAEENSIGDTQIMYVYLAAIAVVVCILVVVFDFVRNRKAV
jgi:uncharacterized Zn finger protein (UPF0148 family)